MKTQNARNYIGLILMLTSCLLHAQSVDRYNPQAVMASYRAHEKSIQKEKILGTWVALPGSEKYPSKIIFSDEDHASVNELKCTWRATDSRNETSDNFRAFFSVTCPGKEIFTMDVYLGDSAIADFGFDHEKAEHYPACKDESPYSSGALSGLCGLALARDKDSKSLRKTAYYGREGAKKPEPRAPW